MITYANYDSFVSSLKKIMEKQTMAVIARFTEKGLMRSPMRLLSWELSEKLIVGKYGSASEMVYTGLKYAATGYTEEDAKKA